MRKAEWTGYGASLGRLSLRRAVAETYYIIHPDARGGVGIVRGSAARIVISSIRLFGRASRGAREGEVFVILNAPAVLRSACIPKNPRGGRITRHPLYAGGRDQRLPTCGAVSDLMCYSLTMFLVAASADYPVKPGKSMRVRKRRDRLDTCVSLHARRR